MKESNLVEDMAALLKSDNLADLYARTKQLALSLGFDHFIYGIRLNVGTGGTHDVVISGYPMKWRKIYDEHALVQHDPTVKHCFKTSLPLVWSDEMFRGDSRSEIWSEAKRHGLQGGVTIPLHTRQRETGMLSLACETSDFMLPGNLTTLSMAHLLSVYVHEAAYRLALPLERERLAPIKLTQREKECLKWSAIGKSSWEISVILGTSERTINFHMGNVLQKMEVANRRQAVVKALSLGLITF